jgi:hypothetical protein
MNITSYLLYEIRKLHQCTLDALFRIIHDIHFVLHLHI